MNTRKERPGDNVDLREQLVNDGAIGPIEQVSLSVSLITRINGILFDIDPGLFQSSTLIPEPNVKPGEFFKRYVAQWLDRHPVLKKAEVRLSGTGLHVLLWLDQPIELKDELDRKRWAARVEVIQSALPIDPNQPGINGMTRPVGSINGKNDAEVTCLREGHKVSQDELRALVDDILRQPFKGMIQTLAGSERCECPLCQEDELGASDQIGRCYTCGKVTRDKLLGAIYAKKNGKNKGVHHAA
jgi:hypothetical protein